MSTDSRKKIAIFGHYGNQNMGDEAIIEAAIKNIRAREPNAEIVCMSINPIDSEKRHGVKAFPIRFRREYFQPSSAQKEVSTAPTITAATPNSDAPITAGLKQRLKSIPILGFLLKGAAKTVDASQNLLDEIYFLKQGSAFLKEIDLLMITGSNQFLDNFGGAWGFPYTLLKWTLLAQRNNTKVAFVSVGAGPLTLPLSYRMLKHALKKADYVSYRDEGSKALIESKIDIDAPIYPDVAHSLGCQPISTTKMASEPRTRQGQLTIAVNPMPVYDKRYWYLPDDDKFQDYIEKVCLLCETILNDGNKLTLFSTQIRDENVIDDIMERLSKNSNISAWLPQISEAKCAEVSELMSTLNQADVIVATRFHATVLPLQLNKPTIGICYYRKAAELLDEFGMQDFHVDIDHFDAETLIQQYRAILPKRTDIQRKINSRFNQYRDLLNEQYGKILGLIQN